MTKITFTYGPAWAERQGGTLTATMSYRRDGKKLAPRTWQAAQLDAALSRWFNSAAEGDRVEVFTVIDGEGQVAEVRMARPPAFVPPVPDPRRAAEVTQRGGAPNPYTFIPTPPRTDLPAALDNGLPAPHGTVDTDSQWSGWLVLRLTTQTPLLLPDPEAVKRDADKHPTYPVRTGPDGKPLLHGASVKGALRSAYESVTNSRYGVFRGHDRPLAYRRPASKEDRSQVTAARIESDGDGGLQFQLCKYLPVPLYTEPGKHRTKATGQARTLIDQAGDEGWSALHGKEVTYTIREITPKARKPGQKVRPRQVVDTIDLATPARNSQAKRGWLSITGRSIETKTSERLFTPDNQRPVPVTELHHDLWRTVLASYRDAAEYNEPGRDKSGQELQRSRHVTGRDDLLLPLAEGTLVYLDYDKHKHAVSAVHPVMIGRLPYQKAPADLLDPSLHPAAVPSELSPADRVFGWAPTGSDHGRQSSSGYRGRIRVTTVSCTTDDWLTDHSPGGVTLAPLNSPKPTQFRFYNAATATGEPVKPRASKSEGYRDGSGIRGRKAYWYPNSAPDEYWTSGRGKVDGHYREWQEPPEAKKSQTSTHLGWVRKGAEFTIRLFVDAVSGAELGPLIWLCGLPGCPLRLGAAKPLGFGAMTVAIDWEATELRTSEALRGCWLDLTRPDPSPQEQIQELAAEFGEQAKSAPALVASIAAFQRVAQGLETPASYPRTRNEPEAETYRWFVANEHIDSKAVEYGFALPHVLEDDQELPRLPRKEN